MAEADSNGTPAHVSDEDFDLGADLAVDIQSEPTNADSPSDSAGTPDFNPDAVDRNGANSESISDANQKGPDWLKEREKELQAVMTRRTQEAASEKQRYEDLREQLLHSQATNQTAQAAPVDPLQDLRQRLGEDASAVDVVQDIVKAVTGNSAETQAAELSQLKSAVTTLAQLMAQNQTAGVSKQVAEARAAYPDLDAYADQIKALVPVTNPATQQPYTVTEAYELVTGLSATKSQNLQNAERQVRSDASRQTALKGAVGAANSEDGELSSAQLHAGLRQLGFE
jgi:hypothetical protein